MTETRRILLDGNVVTVTRDGDLLVAASLHGSRGMVCITPRGRASLAVAGNGIVGLAGLPDGNFVLATREALYHLRG